MRLKLLTALFTIVTFGSYAQESVSGVIRNAYTGEPMPYVTIGVEGKGAGAVTDREGRFKIYLNENIVPTDTIAVSHVGFHTRKFTLAQFPADGDVGLSPRTYEVEQITVTNRLPVDQLIGHKGKGTGVMHCTFYIRDILDSRAEEKISPEVGMLFKTKYDCRLNTLNFNISRNEFDGVKFRLTLYSEGEDGYPEEVIVNENIEFDVTERYTGLFTYDLSPYDIFITGRKKFIATLTLLEDEASFERNWFMIYGGLGGNFFRRDQPMDKWEKKGYWISLWFDATCYKDK